MVLLDRVRALVATRVVAGFVGLAVVAAALDSFMHQTEQRSDSWCST